MGVQNFLTLRWSGLFYKFLTTGPTVIKSKCLLTQVRNGTAVLWVPADNR